ncbi:MAG: SH3 domain-containing protein [Cyanobacteriota bacterium]
MYPDETTSQPQLGYSNPGQSVSAPAVQRMDRDPRLRSKALRTAASMSSLPCESPWVQDLDWVQNLDNESAGHYPMRGRSFRSSGGFPFGTLMVASVSIGALAALAWQVWQILSPMLEPPSVPQFQQAVRLDPLPSSVSSPTNVAVANVAVANVTAGSTVHFRDTDGPAAGRIAPEAFPPGSRGQVIEPIGLAIRSQPAADGAYQGGIVVGETVTVLEYSADGRWQRVRRELNGQEGWVRAGNLGPVADSAVAATVPSPQVPTSESTPLPTRAPAPAAVSVGEQGRVIEPIGLALRALPTVEGAYIGGVPMNEVVTVLGVSEDGRWQHIRRQDGQEGWVRAGNLAQE